MIPHPSPTTPPFSNFPMYFQGPNVNMSSVSPNTRSVLKDMLQNKQAQVNQANQEPKNDANTFMGQKICSPTACKYAVHLI